MTQGISVMH